ncbi:MAG: ABC transporter ATP-binding protein [Rhizobiales bacterium]|nr:ABC transporter ATP-binding protein [Hyphomicrobiales bacterium]
MGSVILSGVRKSYGDVEVIKGIDLTVADRELCVFVGPSGCGKSTLLRMIAGLEDIDAGSVLIDGVDVTEAAPAKRGLAMVFQNYALYPHMNAYDNMAYGLRRAGLAKEDVDRRVRAAARKLQIEAMTLADKIVVLRSGIVEQAGAPLELYEHPDNVFVATFIGTPAMNLIPVEVTAASPEVLSVRMADGGRLDVAGNWRKPEPGAKAQLGIRPERVSWGDADGSSPLGRVRLVERFGGETLCYMDMPDGSTVTAKAAGNAALAPGETVSLQFDLTGANLFDADGRSLRVRRTR